MTRHQCPEPSPEPFYEKDDGPVPDEVMEKLRQKSAEILGPMSDDEWEGVILWD